MEETRPGTRLFILLTFLQGLYGAVCVEVIPSANTTHVGDNVTFRVLPLMDIKSGVWDFQNKVLVFWIGEQTEPQDKRATVNTSTGALTLSSVTVADSGVYRLKSRNPPIQANATLTVLEPVSNVAAKVSVSDPVEFNDTVTLTCSASGSSLSFKWLNVSSDITDSEHVALKDDNRTLIISNVSRFDHGPFYCVVSNGIGNGTSPAQNLNISYGPDGMNFTINGSQNRVFPAGSNLTLFCSAKSSPPAQFQWAFNGKFLDKKTPELQMTNVPENKSGNYTCQAHNNRTLRYRSLTETIIIRSHSPELVRPSIQAVALLSFLLAVFLQ